MEEYVYAILYRKEVLDANRYLFVPCYVIKGLYDKEENVFLDELNKSRFLYSDINIINEQYNYCVGEVYTEEELRKKFPNANSLEDLEIKFFEQAEENVTLGYYDKNNNIIKISKLEIEDEVLPMIENTKDTGYYEEMKQQLGTDFSIFLPKHMEKLLEMDDIDDIKTYIRKRQEKRYCYEQEIAKSSKKDIVIIIAEKAINDILKLKTVDEIKMNLEYYINTIMEEWNDDLDDLDDSLDDYYDFEDDESEDDFISEEVLDIKEIVELTDKTYHQIKNSNNKEEVNFLLEYLIGNYLFALDMLEVCKEQGQYLFKSLTYFYVQSQMLDKIEKEADLDILKAKYNQFYHLTRKNLEGVIEEFTKLPGDFVIEEEIKEPEKNLEVEIEDTMKKLNHLVGLENVKESFEEIFDIMLFKKKTEENLSFEEESKHMVFTGNPGTGKTTVAEIVAPLFYQLGYLKSNKVSYISAQDLIGQYVGQTAPKTEALIKKTKGGLIFLDEAYILAGKAQQFGNEAVTVMLKEMEKNQTMFIFAGYKKEMESFIKMNSGLESRIGSFLEFKDYTEEELIEIFKQNIDKVNSKENQEYKLTVTEEALERVKKVVKQAKEIDDFGNGRFVKKLFDAINKQHAKNTRYIDDKEKLYQITEEDIPENILEKIFFNKEKTDSLYSESSIGFKTDSDKKEKPKELKKHY